MKFDLSGKKAVVTGASHGIGLAVVQALASVGAEVIGGARSASEALLTATPHAVEVDLATPDGPRTLVERALAEFGGIDILVNNVGNGVKLAQGFLDTDDDVWQRTFELNLFSAVRATRAALPSIIERKGSIINIGSVNSRIADPRLVHYSAAKAALTNLSKALSAEFSPLGVRVNTITPGPTRTRIWTKPEITTKLGLSEEEFIERNGLSTGTMIEPTEIAALVVLLTSGEVPSVTGSDYLIDAGMVKTL
ncbi:SDR family oxidoreductase [Actinoallomurus liliacearum]|uniref:SDR family oxidoreductase n=1 Tax=Actinoallomurus liliacearum TaxID=1080073 RepID=A0ABP8TPW7_9ACTN